MAHTIDEVWNILTMEGGGAAYQYLWTFGPMGYVYQLYGFDWIKNLYERSTGANTNTANIKVSVDAMKPQLDALYVLWTTGYLRERFDSLFDLVNTNILGTELPNLVSRLEAIEAKLEILGTFDDVWDGGQTSIAALLRKAFELPAE